MTTSQQTRSYLMKKFETIGIHPRGKLGQNFLIDMNLLHLLYESATLTDKDVVLEVGTGTGSLTTFLAKLAGHVVTVELDSVLHELAQQEVFHHDVEKKNNVTFLLGDILRNKNRLNEEVLAAVYQQLDVHLDVDSARRFKLVANLPYNIATPLISNLLLTERPPLSMTVTIQKELADRIVAKPGTSDWGALSLWIQCQCDAEIIRIMAPTVFWPRPKVQSAIIRITFNEKKRRRVPDLKFFHEFVRAMFFHRRKYLKSELNSAFKKMIPKEKIEGIMETMKFDVTTRAETLNVKTMLELCEHCRAAVAHLPENERKIL